MKFMFFANTDWYLYNFRMSTALHLKEQGAEVVMLSPPGSFGHRFAEQGIRWVTLPAMDRASLNPVREAWTLRQVVRVLSEERPDLLHNFTVKCAVYGALAARMAGVPAVVNAVAGMGYVFTSDAIMARTLRPVVKVLMRGTLGTDNSRLVLQNPDDAHAFVNSRLVPKQNIRLIRSSGVNTFRFAPAERSQGSTGPLRVLLAARLVWEKGIREFVDAAALVKSRGCPMEFLLAGAPDLGNPRSVEQTHVDEWVTKGLVTWLGHVDDMPELLRSVDVMALPSYYREGVPKSLIEGAACGLALVTTNLPGCREVVSCHGVDGLHATPRDAGSLADLLIGLHEDRALLRRLGESARRKALSDFDEKIVISRTLEVYDELLGARSWRLAAGCEQSQPAREAA
ncbi:glycosyltransferase family 4 protein [Lysobacter sp. Root494]|uniref:glycosyltransferase family 4 protein n=1 Tax=Lysobacter sp. Root494 TaxID=1736549 RepID=UPI000A93E979|nr:glycosyltransferase family 4 protein [Lysobacter sp. Root494]